MAARRPRGLTETDRALWRAYTLVAAVAPLPGRALPMIPVIASPVPAPIQAASGNGPSPAPAAPPPRPGRAPPPAALHIGTSPGGIEARRWRDLCRGRTRPERTLDLHGSRAHDAHSAVRRFLRDAQADGLRCVAIVTGKGPAPAGGVLKRELPYWLNAPDLRPLLLGAAHPHAANAGAVHLLIRKPGGRPPPGRLHRPS